MVRSTTQRLGRTLKPFFMDAQRAGDNYRLSIWRDVRRILEAWVEGEKHEQNTYIYVRHAAGTCGYGEGLNKFNKYNQGFIGIEPKIAKALDQYEKSPLSL
jgi:hypothetical protein